MPHGALAPNDIATQIALEQAAKNDPIIYEPARRESVPDAVGNYVDAMVSGVKEPPPLPKVAGSHAGMYGPSRTSQEYIQSLKPVEDAVGPSNTNGAAPVAAVPGAAQPLVLARPQVIGAHHDESLYPFTKKTQLAQQNALTRHEESVDEMTAAKVAQLNDVAQFHRQNAEDAQIRAAIQHEQEQNHQAAYQQAMKKYERLVDEAAAGTIDPKRYMDSQETGTRILMAIGAGLGGFAGDNSVLNIIQKNIDRDIAAQEKQLASKQWQAGAQQNMLGELRAQGMDTRQAANALESMQWRIAEEWLNARMAMSNTKIEQAAATAMKNQFNDKRVGLYREHDSMTHVKPHVVGGAGSASQDQMNGRFVATGTNGEGYIARSDKEGDKGRDLEATDDNLQYQLNKLQALSKKSNFFARLFAPIYKTDNTSEMSSRSKQAMFAIKEAEKLGALDAQSAQAGIDAIGDVMAVFGNPIPAMQAVSDTSTHKKDSFRKSQAGQSAVQGLSVTPKGEIRANAVGQAGFSSPGRTRMPAGSQKIGR